MGGVTWKTCRSLGMREAIREETTVTGTCFTRSTTTRLCIFPTWRATFHHVKPLTDMVGDLSANPPAFVWVTPNMIDDMHDGPLTVGDTWLSQQIPSIQATAWVSGRGGTIIVLWDEGRGLRHVGHRRRQWWPRCGDRDQSGAVWKQARRLAGR